MGLMISKSLMDGCTARAMGALTALSRGEGGGGQASDIEIQANEILRMRAWLEDTLAHHTGRARDEISRDIERDKILTAAEAKEYGLIDEVLASRKATLDD